MPNGFSLKPVDFDPFAKESMTHRASQPNPAAPYLKAASDFASGGIVGAMRGAGASLPGAVTVPGDVLTSPAAQTALGIFSGRLPPFERELAEGMEFGRFKPEHIKEATGLERGAEGMWRKEISDVGSKFKSPKEIRPYLVKELLEHNKLFEDYPELANMRVTFNPNLEALGEYDSVRKQINLKTMTNPETLKSILLHELQHAVQHREGFALDVPFSKNLGFSPKDPEGRYLSESEIYKRLASEVEARNVEQRAKLGSKGLATETEDVPRIQQIIGLKKVEHDPFIKPRSESNERIGFSSAGIQRGTSTTPQTITPRKVTQSQASIARELAKYKKLMGQPVESLPPPEPGGERIGFLSAGTKRTDK